MSALRVKNTSESDPCSYEVTLTVANKAQKKFWGSNGIHYIRYICNNWQHLNVCIRLVSGQKVCISTKLLCHVYQKGTSFLYTKNCTLPQKNSQRHCLVKHHQMILHGRMPWMYRVSHAHSSQTWRTCGNQSQSTSLGVTPLEKAFLLLLS